MPALSPQQLNAPLHILLIEDDEGDRDLALAYLKEDSSQFYQVTWAASLEAGLTKIATTRFDAIILDLVLPDSRGVATVSKLCAHSRGIPVIVSSYFDENTLARKVIELGAQDYLAKDRMDSQTLGQTLLRSLARAQHQTRLLSGPGSTHTDPLLTEKVSQLQADLQRLEAVAGDVNQVTAKGKELDDLRQRLITTLSHECRTPATVVLLATNILKSYDTHIEDDKYLPTLARMEEAVHQLMQLLDSALTFKQTQSLVGETKPETLNLQSLCQEIVSNVKAAHAPTPNISVDYSADCEDVYQYRAAAEHILTQLLTNAIIYSPQPARVQLTIRQDKKQLTIQVQDWGCGISTAEQSQVFEAFYRSSYVENIHGLGLGLTIVKTCVDMCGGQILLDSQVDKGTTATVILPELPMPKAKLRLVS